MVRLQAQLALQRRDKHAKHVEQHAVAGRFDDGQYFHVHQRCEDDGAFALGFTRVVDLPHRLMGLVNAVNKRQAHVARRHLKLGQNRVAECLGRDARAVRNEKYGAIGHVDLQNDSGW